MVKFKKITALFLAVALMLSLSAALFSCGDEPFDYVGEDLDEYIYISDANYTGYKGYEVTIASDEITDDTVRSFINAILVEKRGEASNLGKKEFNSTIEIGDDVCLFYRGLVKDENGNLKEVTSFSNFSVTEEKKRIFTLGKGTLDALGLYTELKLVGCDLSKYAGCQIVSESDTVGATDFVYVSYDAIYGGASSKQIKDECIDLTSPGDKAHLVEFLVGKTVGETYSPNAIFTDKDGTRVIYNNVKIERVMRFPDQGQEPFKVVTKVPATCSDTTLQGKEITLEFYIDYTVKYETPTFDEEFITKTLEVKAESLENYDGEGLVDKYFDYVRTYLKAVDESEIDSVMIEAMWSHLYSIAQIKKLPEDEVDRIYNEYKIAIKNAYDQNPGDYATVDEFANAYVKDTSGSDMVWTDFFRKESEEEVKQKLIFYYVAKREGLLPTDAEFWALKEQMIESDVATALYQSGILRENYKTDAEYEAAAAPKREEVLKNYEDDEYTTWIVHYEFAVPKMSKFGKVIYKNPAE